MALLTLIRNCSRSARSVQQIFTIKRNIHVTCSKKPQILARFSANLAPQKRTFLNYLKFFKRTNAEEARLLDNVPDSFRLIYRSGFEMYFFYGRLVLVTTTVVLTAALFATGNLSSTDVDNQQVIFLIGFASFMVAIYSLMYKSPMRIYYSLRDKRYIFIFYGSYPTSLRQLRCQIGDVEKLEETGLLPWKESKYRIKDQQEVILLENYFKRPADLYIMMGLQRDPEDPDDKPKN